MWLDCMIAVVMIASKQSASQPSWSAEATSVEASLPPELGPWVDLGARPLCPSPSHPSC